MSRSAVVTHGSLSAETPIRILPNACFFAFFVECGGRPAEVARPRLVTWQLKWRRWPYFIYTNLFLY
jgi:hypothetical protein